MRGLPRPVWTTMIVTPVTTARGASQVDIPACVSVALKIEIEASKGSKQFDHVLCGCRWCGPDRHIVRCLFKQACGEDLEFHPACGSLSSEFVLRLGSDIKSDGHGWPPEPLSPRHLTE